MWIVKDIQYRRKEQLLTMLLCTACVHSSVWPWSVHLWGHQELCCLDGNMAFELILHKPTAPLKSSINDHLTKVCINEDGLCSCYLTHGFQVPVMPAVSLHIIVWYKRFTSLCQSNYTNHLHFPLHLHMRERERSCRFNVFESNCYYIFIYWRQFASKPKEAFWMKVNKERKGLSDIQETI